MSSRPLTWWGLAGAVLVVLLAGCGSGGGGEEAAPAPEPTVVETTAAAPAPQVEPTATSAVPEPGDPVPPTTTATTAPQRQEPGAALGQLPAPGSCDDLLVVLAAGITGLDPADHTGGFELLGIDPASASFDLNLHSPTSGPWRMLRVRTGELVTTLTGSEILDEAELYLGSQVVAGELDLAASSTSGCFSYVYGAS